MKLMSWIGCGAAVLLCVYVAVNALRYLDPGFVGPDFIMQNTFADPWLVTHAGLAAVALLIGPAQFVPAVRARWPRAHRWLGRTYLAACLASGLAGLVLAPGSQAGPVAVAGFASLGAISVICAVQAWRTAMARRFEEHREWVVRSFSLILAGVTLRLWIPAVFISGLDFMESYRVISFLAWVPNLIVAELYLARGRARRVGLSSNA